MLARLLTFPLILAMFSVAACARYAGEDKQPPDEEVAKVLEKYNKTGNVENCVHLTRVDSTRVINDYNILFKMKGNKAYLNTLPNRCPRLGFEKSFSYRVSTNQLCNVDIITVFDDTGMHGPSCGLGKFVEYEEKD